MADSIEDIFSGLEAAYRPGVFKEKATYYFSLGDDEKWTVTVGPRSCKVRRGKHVAQADCVLKTTPELFLKMWNGRYTPGVGDFLSGRIKSNDPQRLKPFLDAFK